MKVDWENVRISYVSSTESAAEVAKRFGLTHDAVRKRAERGDWLSQRKAMTQAVASVAQAKIAKSRAEELAEFDRADAAMSRALRTVAARMLAESSREGAPRLTATEARTIASLAETAQKIGRIALGGTTENVGHAGVAGAPPVLVGAALPEAVAKAMNDYLSDY